MILFKYIGFEIDDLSIMIIFGKRSYGIFERDRLGCLSNSAGLENDGIGIRYLSNILYYKYI